MILIWPFCDFWFNPKLNIRKLKSISQGIYTQYCPDRQIKCLSVCLSPQFAKLNVHQMYHVYSGLENYQLWIEVLIKLYSPVICLHHIYVVSLATPVRQIRRTCNHHVPQFLDHVISRWHHGDHVIYIHSPGTAENPPSYVWQDAIHSGVLSNIIGTLMLVSMADTAARYVPLIWTLRHHHDNDIMLYLTSTSPSSCRM